MGRTLTLELPEHICQSLTCLAERTGHSPEELALVCLETASRSMMDDPVENFIGAIKSDIPDWADQHDQYVGNALMKKLLEQGD